MITHLVLITPRAGLSDAEHQELDEAVSSLRNVPGVRDFTHGHDFSGRSRGFSLVATMYFDGRDALQGYLEHAEHLRVVDILNRLAPERLVVDYETGTNGISGITDSAHNPS